MGSHAALRREVHESRADRIADIAHVARGVHEHERHMHKGEKPTKLKLRDGGVADDSRGYPTDASSLAPALSRGENYAEGKKRASGGRMDRKHHAKGHGKSGSKVNVIVQAPPPPMPQRVPVPVPAGAGAMPPRPMPPAAGGIPPGPPPPQAMPMRPPMAGPPPGAMPPAAMPHKDGGDACRKRGGRMTAGAGSGEGRLEKSEMAAEENRGEPRARGGRLTAHERQGLPKSDFALPGKGKGPKGAGAGSYPIPDESHARNALARVSQHGSAAEKATVRRKVHAKFPGIHESA